MCAPISTCVSYENMGRYNVASRTPTNISYKNTGGNNKTGCSPKTQSIRKNNIYKNSGGNNKTGCNPKTQSIRPFSTLLFSKTKARRISTLPIGMKSARRVSTLPFPIGKRAGFVLYHVGRNCAPDFYFTILDEQADRLDRLRIQ